jgi:2-dehydropantoate 2-reductase
MLYAMKTAVVGCGGVGGVVAGVLALRGQDVTCFMTSEDKARALRERGVGVEGSMGRFTVRVKAAVGVEQGGFDLVVVAVKNDALDRALDRAESLLCAHGVILTVQNGIRVVDKAAGRSCRVAAGAVGFNAVMLDYGRYQVTSRGGITAGGLSRCSTEDLFLLKGLLAPRIPVRLTGNIRGVLWSKLITVCAVTGLGGVAGLPLGRLLREGSARRLFSLVAGEGVRVASAAGVRLERFSGGVHPRLFARGVLPPPARFLLLAAAGLRYRNLKSNIHHSLQQGMRTEVDYINGALVEQGERHGVPTPVNREIVRTVHEIEAGGERMGPHHLRRILRGALEAGDAVGACR